MELHEAVVLLDQEEDQWQNRREEVAQTRSDMRLHPHRGWTPFGPGARRLHWRLPIVWLITHVMCSLPSGAFPSAMLKQAIKSGQDRTQTQAESDKWTSAATLAGASTSTGGLVWPAVFPCASRVTDVCALVYCLFSTTRSEERRVGKECRSRWCR